MPHLSLICSQYTYEGLYKYISPHRGVSRWGGRDGQSACFSYDSGSQSGGTYSVPAWPRRRLGAGCTVPEVSCALKALSGGWIGCDLVQRTTQTRRRSYLCSPDEIHRWFRLTGAETSIKTRRLSLNLSLAPRRKQPLQELLPPHPHPHTRTLPHALSQHTCALLPEDGEEAEMGRNLFCTWENNQVAVLHRLSVSDRYFCQAGNEPVKPFARPLSVGQLLQMFHQSKASQPSGFTRG